MKHLIGIDIIKNSRIKLDEKFLKKFLTINEIKMLKSFNSKNRKIEFASGRWAVKEAIFKVLKKEIPLNQIEIGYKNKKPIILNKELKNVSISISHEKKYSVGAAFLLEV